MMTCLNMELLGVPQDQVINVLPCNITAQLSLMFVYLVENEHFSGGAGADNWDYCSEHCYPYGSKEEKYKIKTT